MITNEKETHALEWGFRVEDGFLLVGDGSSSGTRFIELIDEADRMWVAFLAFGGSSTIVDLVSS